MARHYSTRLFFRQVPNVLLARYFESQGLFKDLDFFTLKETKPDRLFDAWLALPDLQRRPMDALFQTIFDLSCDKGCRAIIDEAKWQLRKHPGKLTAFIAQLSAMPNHYHRTMATYLDYHDCWHGATRFFHADSLHARYWRKRKNMGHQRANTDDDTLRALAKHLSDYFYHTQGRGHHCLVEAFRRDNMDYFFAYPEDYSQQQIEWVDGEFDQRSHNPAFEMVFVYSQQDGSLDLNYQGNYQTVNDLQGIFATTILSLPQLPDDPKDNRVYHLLPLAQRGFQFCYDSSSGIQSVAISALRFTSLANNNVHITIDVHTPTCPEMIFDEIDKLCHTMRLPLCTVTKVSITAIVCLNDKPKRTTFQITYPNSCSLKYDQSGLILRQMLVQSGIEPQPPENMVQHTAA